MLAPDNPVICVSVTVRLVIATAPIFTEAPSNRLPVMVIGVPPAIGPALGVTKAMVGNDSLVYVNALGFDALPLGVVTTIVLAPALAEGVSRLI